jgi:hypothetical protein
VIVASIEAINTFVQREKDDVKEFSRLAVNATKTFEQTSRDTANASIHQYGG